MAKRTRLYRQGRRQEGSSGESGHQDDPTCQGEDVDQLGKALAAMVGR